MLSNYLETYYIPLCLYVAAAAAAAAATTAAAATAAAATIKNGKETSFLYKKLYLGHLNMNITYCCLYWCKGFTAAAAAAAAASISYGHTGNDQKQVFLWYNSHKIKI